MAANLELVIKAHDQASAVLKGVDDSVHKTGSAMGTVLKLGALGAAAGIAGAGVAAIKFIGVASDLNESINKANVVFGQSADVVTQFAETSAKSFGIARGAAFGYTSVLGTILKGSGLSEGASADMSVTLTKLAADMASFNNIPIDQALEKIRAGLVGESEPLRTVGVLLSETAVKEKAYAMGIAATGAVLTDAQKVQARYALILEQTKDTQGDFARTSDGLANQQRILGAQWKDLQGIIGNALLPVAVKLGAVFVNLATSAMPKLQAFIKTVTNLGRAFIAAASGEGVTSTGIFGFFEELGVIVHDKVIPAIKDFASFFKGQILPAVKEFVSNKANLIALGGAVAGLFTLWAITAGIAAVATLAAAAPLLLVAAAFAGLGAAIVIIERKTGFFTKTLIPALKDVAKWAGPILSDALVTLKQGWQDLQPAVTAVGGFLKGTVLPVLATIGKYIVEHKPLLIGLSVAILALIAPWLLVIGAIVLVLAKWDEIKAMFTKTIPDAIDSVIRKIEELPVIGTIFKAAVDVIALAINTYIWYVQHLLIPAIVIIASTINASVVPAFNGFAWGINNIVIPAIDGVVSFINNVLGPTLNGIAGVAASISGALSSPFRLARDWVKVLWEWLGHLIERIGKVHLPDITPDLSPGFNAPDIPLIGRQMGGPVHRGLAYLVGERGPEPFIPSTNGTVLPSSALGGSVAINIYPLPHQDARDIAREVKAIFRNLERRGR